MQIRQTPGRKPFLLLVALTLIIAGCSRINLAYRNLDTLIPWWIDDYLDLDRAQEKRFRAQLRDHLSWHCQTQLPVYLDIIGQLQHQVRRDEINEATLRTHYQHAKQAIQAITEEITPTTTQLLRDLDDAQVRTLNEALEKDRRERAEKYLQPPLDQQIRERAERMGERVEHWLGTISAAQRQRILVWAHSLGEHNRLWLDNRVQWQHALSAAVAQRHEVGFDDRIARLLQGGEAFWTAEYRAAFDRIEQAALDLASDLYAMSDTDQRSHFDGQLENVRKDLGSLACLPESR
ncbi:DUF6279 family lipoprotein [Pseudomonas sp. CBC3]|uniref:DUF6279 family lipoprotein n=1 Tax=Pseudomonas sp. CBC3 TaxID=3123318 RepID=UPI0030E76FA1